MSRFGPPPPNSVRCSWVKPALLVLATAVPASALADADCGIMDPALGDPRSLTFAWDLSSSPGARSALLVYVPDAEAVTIEVEWTLHFDGVASSWLSETYVPEPMDVLAVPVEVPVEAVGSDEQEARLSSLVATVWAWRGEDLATSPTRGSATTT